MFKTWAKFLLLLVVCCLFFTGCANYNYSVEGGPAASEQEISNGGLAVKKGNYIYYINGLGTTSSENEFGKPVKGSIVRMDLESGQKVIVVPKVVLSSYYKAGFFIFDDRIYYASPSMEKDKNGNRLSSYLDFFSVKINGSGTKKIITLTNNSFPYKFYKENGRVYLLYIDTTNQKVYNIDCESGAIKTVLDSYGTTPVIADDGYLYYTNIIYKDEAKTQQYPYNEFKRIKYNGQGGEEIKFSGGSTITSQHYKITLNDVKIFDGKTTLFYTKQSAQNIEDPRTLSDPFLYSYVMGDPSDTQLVASVSNTFQFTENYYLSPISFFGVYNEELYYVYYTQPAQEIFEHVRLMPRPSQILGTMSGENGKEYIIYSKSVDGKNKLFKKQYTGEGLDLSEGDVLFEDIGLNMSTYLPEIIDDVIYFIGSDEDNTDTVYRYHINSENKPEKISIDEKDEEEVDE